MRKAVVWTLAALASGFLALPAGADEDDDRNLEQRIEKLEKLFARLEKKIDRALADRPGEEKKDREETFEKKVEPPVRLRLRDLPDADKKVEPPVRLWLRALPEGEDRDRVLKFWKALDDEDGKPDVERLREAARRLRERRFEFHLDEDDITKARHPAIPGLKVLKWNVDGREAKVTIVIDGKTYEGTIRRVEGDREPKDRDRAARERSDREDDDRDDDDDEDDDRDDDDDEDDDREDDDGEDCDREDEDCEDCDREDEDCEDCERKRKERKDGDREHKDRKDGDREHKDREPADRARRERERKNRDKDKDKDGDREERDFLFEWKFEDGEGPDVLIPSDEAKPRIFLRRLVEENEGERELARPRVVIEKVVEALPAEKAKELTEAEARRVERELERVRDRLKKMERELEEEKEEF